LGFWQAANDAIASRGRRVSRALLNWASTRNEKARAGKAISRAAVSVVSTAEQTSPASGSTASVRS